MIAVCVIVTYQYVLSRMVIDALIVLTPQVEKHHVTTVHARRESCACSDVFWIFLNWSKFVWLINFGTAVSVLEFRSVRYVFEYLEKMIAFFDTDVVCVVANGLILMEWTVIKFTYVNTPSVSTGWSILHYKINEKISTTTFWTFSFRQLHAMLTTPITCHFFYQTTKQNKITRKWSYSNNRFLI